MARNKNIWCGTGRLGADPEVRTTQAGTKVAQIRVACSRDWKDKNGEKQQSTFWAPVTVWGPTAEVVEKHLRKGDLIRVEGPLVNKEWEDKKGNKRHSIEVNISGFNGEIEFLSTPNRSQQSNGQQYSGQSTDHHTNGYAAQAFDDEIPF